MHFYSGPPMHLLSGVDSLALKQLEGRYAYFVGGVYGHSPRTPITDATPEVRLYYPTKRAYIEWMLDPKFLMSMSSIGRVGGKNRYRVLLGKNSGVQKRGESNLCKCKSALDCITHSYVDRTPKIALHREYERDIAEQEQEVH
jgi:hypothetical protein